MHSHCFIWKHSFQYKTRNIPFHFQKLNAIMTHCQAKWLILQFFISFSLFSTSKTIARSKANFFSNWLKISSVIPSLSCIFRMIHLILFSSLQVILFLLHLCNLAYGFVKNFPYIFYFIIILYKLYCLFSYPRCLPRISYYFFYGVI